MCDSKDGAAASMPLLPRRWQRVEMPVAELVESLREVSAVVEVAPLESGRRSLP